MNTVIEFLLIFIVLLSPLDYGAGITVKPLIAISLASLLLCLLYFLKKTKDGTITLLSTPLNLPILLFLLFAFSSFCYSIDRFVTLYGLCYLFNYAVFFFIIVNAFSTIKDVQRILRLIITLSTLFSLLGLFQYFTYTTPFSFCSEGRAYGIFITPNTFAAYLILVLPLLFSLFFFTEKKGPLLALIIINYLGLLASQSRGAWLSLFLALFILLSLRGALATWQSRKAKALPYGKFSMLLFSLAVVTSLFFFSGSILPKKTSGQNFGSDKHVPADSKQESGPYTEVLKRASALAEPLKAPSAQARLKFYQSAFKVIKKYPLSGTGWYTYHLIYPSVKDPSFGTETHFYVHNDYLQILSELGVFGFLSLLTILFFYFRSGIRLLRKIEGERFALVSGSLAGSLALLIHSLFEFNLYIMSLAIILFFYFGLLFLVAKERGIIKSPSVPLLQRGIRGITIKPQYKKMLSGMAISFFLIIGFLLLCPLFSEVYTNAGAKAFKNRDYPKAEGLLKKALLFSPLASNYHTNLALVHQILGKRSSAEAEYRKGIALSSYQAENWFALGRFYLESSEADVGQGFSLASFREGKEKSLFYFQKAVSLDPTSRFYRQALERASQELKW